MSRQTVIKKNFTFVGGLNTDAGYLTSSENSWRDGDNIIPQLNGELHRREKIDLETGFVYSGTFSTYIKETQAFGVSEWHGVGGDGLLNFAVVQRGTTISFYDTSASAISPAIKSFSINLNTYRYAASPLVAGVSRISTATGNGKLLMVAEDLDPILVSYNVDTDTITVTVLSLKVRDFLGLPETDGVSVTPTTLTPTHNYNLKNQGWPQGHIDQYKADSGVYPSNAQVWIQGRNATNDFSSAELNKQAFGSSAAPKGAIIFDLFSRDRGLASAIVGIPIEVEDYRPCATGFFAGRAWYAGMSSNTIGSWVVFSKIADTDSKYQECYQDGDPTAEWTNDLLASDGGVIPIPNAGGILALYALQDSLLVFARNGIWQILGDAAGFKATGYQVKQVSSFGINAAHSIVPIESTLAFWSTGGIYILVKDNISGDYTTKSMTQGKIKALYEEIQQTSNAAYVQGFYDSANKIVYWLYDDLVSTTLNRFTVHKILNFDVLLGAFYTQSLPDLAANSPVIIGGFLAENSGNALVDYTVTASGFDVLSGVDTVVMSGLTQIESPRIPKFLTLVPSGTDWVLTFSDFLNTLNTPYKFRDWYSKDNIGIETPTLPYVITNYEILDDAARNFQAPYIITHLVRTETGVDSDGNGINGSSCQLRGCWDWADNSVATRWTTPQEVYRHRQAMVFTLPSATYIDGYPLIVSKSKIRGKGKSLFLKYESSAGLDLRLAGWAIQYAKNTNV